MADLCAWSHAHSGGLCPGFSVWAVGHCPGGLCAGGSLSKEVSVQGMSERDNPSPESEKRAVHTLQECFLV